MGSREEEEDVEDVGMGRVRRAANWWGFWEAHWANEWGCARVDLVMVRFLSDRDSFRSLTLTTIFRRLNNNCCKFKTQSSSRGLLTSKVSALCSSNQRLLFHICFRYVQEQLSLEEFVILDSVCGFL